MTNRVDTLVDVVQRAATQSTLDGARAQAKGEQLTTADETVLATCKVSDPLIRAYSPTRTAFSFHMNGNAVLVGHETIVPGKSARVVRKTCQLCAAAVKEHQRRRPVVPLAQGSSPYESRLTV